MNDRNAVTQHDRQASTPTLNRENCLGELDLRKRMTEDMQLRRFSDRTIESYI